MPGERQGAFGGTDNGGTGGSQFLLARYVNEGGARSSKRASRSAGPDRAQFVENLLLNTLLPNVSLWRVRASQLASSTSYSGDKAESAPAVTQGLEEQRTPYHSGPEEEPSEGLEAAATTISATAAANEPGDDLSDADVSPEPRRRRSSRYRNDPEGNSNK